MSDRSYILYGVPPSYFVGKVRSYLRKKGLDFEERLCNGSHFLDVVVPKVGLNTMPIIETSAGEFVQDTTQIIDFLEARHPKPSVYPLGPKQRLVALLFELYGDDGLLAAGVHYRWHYLDANREFLVQEFASTLDPNEKRFLDHAGVSSTREMAEEMARALPEMADALGADETGAPAIEASYEEFLDLFEIHCQHYPYLLGGRPSIGDFGLIAPFHGHLTRDPYPADMVKRRAASVYRWVERMNAPDSGMAFFPDMPHEFLSDDAIPETLLPILKLIADDYMPEIESILDFMASWVRSHPDFPSGTPINPPGVLLLGTRNVLGTHTVEMRGVPITRPVRYYSQWMFQRVLDHYASLTERERADVDALLESTGLLPYLNLKVPRRMERLNNQEVFA
jgi:glutathione S-transferase